MATGQKGGSGGVATEVASWSERQLVGTEDRIGKKGDWKQGRFSKILWRLDCGSLSYPGRHNCVKT